MVSTICWGVRYPSQRIKSLYKLQLRWIRKTLSGKIEKLLEHDISEVWDTSRLLYVQWKPFYGDSIIHLIFWGKFKNGVHRIGHFTSHTHRNSHKQLTNADDIPIKSDIMTTHPSTQYPNHKRKIHLESRVHPGYVIIKGGVDRSLLMAIGQSRRKTNFNEP